MRGRAADIRIMCGEVVERLRTVVRRFDGHLHELENVPLGICIECGQRIFKGPVLVQMRRLARSRKRVKKVIRLPVSDYRSA